MAEHSPKIFASKEKSIFCFNLQFQSFMTLHSPDKVLLILMQSVRSLTIL